MVDGSPKGSLGKDQTGSGEMAREWPIRLRLERKLLGEPRGGRGRRGVCEPQGAAWLQHKARNGQKAGCFLKSSADQSSWPTSRQRRPQSLVRGRKRSQVFLCCSSYRHNHRDLAREGSLVHALLQLGRTWIRTCLDSKVNFHPVTLCSPLPAIFPNALKANCPLVSYRPQGKYKGQPSYLYRCMGEGSR